MATVHPVEKFSYAQDGEKLRAEMKGFGTDEQAIITLLISRSHSQRMLIVKYFKEEYNRDILDELKEELGEKYDDLTYALIALPAEHISYELNTLLEADTVDERALIEIFCTRGSDEIKEIINQYPKSYERTLAEHIGSASPGRRLVVAILNGAKNGQSPEEVVKSETSDELKEAVSLAAECISNPVAFFTNSLKIALEGEINNKALTRIIVSRSEIDLANIKKEYENAVNRTLGSDLKNKASDDYKVPLCRVTGDA